VYDLVGYRPFKPGEKVFKPEDDPSKPWVSFHELKEKVPAIKPPAVWFPHTIMGISTSDILTNTTGSKFGPFDGQLFVGDQGHSKIMRVALEKVNGVYQGVVFPFREGFMSGVLRMDWGTDGSMFVGMTNRGWGSNGTADYGLQRLVWTGKMPFEMKTVRAMPDGFEIEFTLPVDKNTASNPAAYEITGFGYKYHAVYGSPVVNDKACAVKGVIVSEDGLRARLVVEGLREKYIHELKAEGVRSRNNLPLLHSVAYYTLNNIPAGDRVAQASLEASNQMHNHGQMMQSSKASAKGAVTRTSNTPAKTAPEKTAAAKRLTKMPASWSKGPDQVISIGTEPGLKFDVKAVQVKAGSKIKLVFNNNDDMLHNFVLVAPGTVQEVGDLAIKLGLKGTEKSYIPDTDKVLYHTNLLQPTSSETIYFTAPTQPGEYTYVCTVPGHAYVMQGTLTVVP
jgi:azurin